MTTNQIKTADEARAMFRENDADATEEVAKTWAEMTYGREFSPGVDADGNVWLEHDVMLSDERLVALANWARENWS